MNQDWLSGKMQVRWLGWPSQGPWQCFPLQPPEVTVTVTQKSLAMDLCRRSPPVPKASHQSSQTHGEVGPPTSAYPQWPHNVCVQFIDVWFSQL